MPTYRTPVAFDANQVVQARAGWINKYSDPKWIGEMPEGQGPRTPEGRAFYDAMREMQAPGGVGAFPHGSEVTIESLSAEASTAFKEALEADNSYVDRVLTGLNTGADGGVYKPKDFWGILHSTVGDDLAAVIRGVNSPIDHYCEFNYGDELPAKDRPALDIPLPDPESDERYDAAAKRAKALADQIIFESNAGAPPDQLRVDALAGSFGTSTIKITRPAKPSMGAAPSPAEGEPAKTPDPAPAEAPPKKEEQPK